MRILGIETSCDETAVAVVSDGALLRSWRGRPLQVKTAKVLSQIKKHEAYGGVVPEVAAREHLQAMGPMLAHEIPFDGQGIDAIAVTAGPGLAPALRVGVETAKTLALLWGVPLIPVCHLEGHIYASWLPRSKRLLPFLPQPVPTFPALCLIVSGGHTELVVVKDHGVFTRIGETLDDAAGEAFDKVAKMLGMSYPGGPQIAKLAVGGQVDAFDFPRGLLNSDNLDFSFSGLKTSVLYTLRSNEEMMKDEAFRRNIAASFQEAVIDVLVRKTMRAAKQVKPSSIVLAGGVAANVALRARMKAHGERQGIDVFVPPLTYSLDNAAMIAAAGYFRAQSEKNFVDPLELAADPNLDLL